MAELRLFDARVAGKPMMVAATKIDALDDPSPLERLEHYVLAKGLRLFPISAVTGEGVTALLEGVWSLMAADATPLDARSPDP